MLETAVQLERDPPETVTSDSVKSVEASERVKVMVVVSPALRDETSDVTAMVGGVLSRVELLVTEVLLSDAASLPWLS